MTFCEMFSRQHHWCLPTTQHVRAINTLCAEWQHISWRLSKSLVLVIIKKTVKCFIKN